MPFDRRLLEILACPKCKGKLEYEEEKDILICKECKLVFKIEDGIPNMILEEAEPWAS